MILQQYFCVLIFKFVLIFDSPKKYIKFYIINYITNNYKKNITIYIS